MNIQLKHKEITEKIIGSAIEVHKFLGNGFQEIIYHRALTLEMTKKGLTTQGNLGKIYFIKTSKNQPEQEGWIAWLKTK